MEFNISIRHNKIMGYKIDVMSNNKFRTKNLIKTEYQHII